MIWDIVITLGCIVAMIFIWIILYDTNRFVIRNYSFGDKRIKKSIRLVVLADLHNKQYGRDNRLLLEVVRNCEPDIILVAGDILTAKPGKKPDVAIRFMEELARDYTIYYGNGNHEHRLKLYPEKYGELGRIYDEALEKMGVHRLINAHADLPEYGIRIYGSEIDRFYYKRFRVQHMKGNYLEGLLGRPGECYYNILLAHNPDYFPQYADWGADMVFSGHVHGGMVRIPFWGKGVVSPNVRLFPAYDGGLFRQDKSLMLLSRGLGMHTIPIRLFNPGEVLVVELNPED